MHSVKTGKTVYIYALFDPREPGHVRYVGKTCNLYLRMFAHKKCILYEKDNHNYKLNWLRKLQRENVQFEYKILETCTNSNWKNKEKYWIKKLKEEGHKLTNATAGGDGCFEPTPEYRKKLSESHKGNQSRLGIPHTKETKKHLSNIKKGMKQYENQKLAIEKYNKSKGKGYAQPNSKKYNINNELLTLYGISIKYKISIETLYKKINNGENIQQIIENHKIIFLNKKYNFNNEMLTLKEASKKYQIKYTTLLYRLKKGIEPSIAILTQVKFNVIHRIT